MGIVDYEQKPAYICHKASVLYKSGLEEEPYLFRQLVSWNGSLIPVSQITRLYFQNDL
jgi:hypothetical protein